jgi:hypothetical protein
LIVTGCPPSQAKSIRDMNKRQTVEIGEVSLFHFAVEEA